MRVERIHAKFTYFDDGPGLRGPAIAMCDDALRIPLRGKKCLYLIFRDTTVSAFLAPPWGQEAQVTVVGEGQLDQRTVGYFVAVAKGHVLSTMNALTCFRKLDSQRDKKNVW